MYGSDPAFSKKIFKSKDRYHHGSNACCAEWIHGCDGKCQSVFLASVHDRSGISYAVFHLCILFHQTDRCRLWRVDRICRCRVHGIDRMADCLLFWDRAIRSMVERMVSPYCGIRTDQCDLVQTPARTFAGKWTDGDRLEGVFVCIFDCNSRVCCEQHQLSYDQYTIFRKVFI